MLKYILKDEYKQEQKTMYFAECLRIATENTAKQVGGQYIKATLFDVLHPKKQDTRTAEEIVDDVLSKLCGKGEQ